MEPKVYWSQKLAEYLPTFLTKHPVLAQFEDRASIFLHGSTCRNVDDSFSDLDLYFILSNANLAKLDEHSPTRFFEFEMAGKPGHLNAVSLTDLVEQVNRCDLPLIAELRLGVLIKNHVDGVTDLLEWARQPMRPEVRQAFFFYHYMQMRNYHRAGDNPMERGDAVAVLLAVSQTLAHTLRAALCLDGEPYPYEKWLYREAVRFPTGKQLAPGIEELLDWLTTNALRRAGSGQENPLNQTLHRLREILIAVAHTYGIHDEWLRRWWLHIDQAEETVNQVRWDAPSKKPSLTG